MATGIGSAVGAGSGAAMSPWWGAAMGGASILEAIVNKLFFGPPKELRRATKQAASKSSELMASHGYDQDVLDSIFGKNFENIRGQGKGVRESTTATMGRAGMLGTGAETSAARKNAWSNENLVTEAMRDLLITGEAKKQSDIALGGQLLGAATGASQATQGQGPALTDMLMTAMLMSQKKAALNPDDLMGLFNPYQQARDRAGVFGLNDPTRFQLGGINQGPVGID